MARPEEVSKFANDDDRQPGEPELDVDDSLVRSGGVDPQNTVTSTQVAAGFDFAGSRGSSKTEDDARTSIDITDCQCLAPDLAVEKTNVSEWYIQVVFCESCERELATITERDSEVGCHPLDK